MVLEEGVAQESSEFGSLDIVWFMAKEECALQAHFEPFVQAAYPGPDTGKVAGVQAVAHEAYEYKRGGEPHVHDIPPTCHIGDDGTCTMGGEQVSCISKGIRPVKPFWVPEFYRQG